MNNSFKVVNKACFSNLCAWIKYAHILIFVGFNTTIRYRVDVGFKFPGKDML